jgi:RNA polymerase sigma-70 factor (ECF subfamily)
MDSLASGMTSRLPLSAADSEPERAQADSRAWLDALRSTGTGRDAAITCLHELLLRAARFEVSRRRAALAHVRGEELDDIALQAADDALVAVLAKLDAYRGASRFTTWAYKVALLEAGVRVRRRAWQEREVVLESEGWPLMADTAQSPASQAEQGELIARARARDQRLPDRAPARGAGSPDDERRAPGRAGRAASHDPRHALQDAS